MQRPAPTPGSCGATAAAGRPLPDATSSAGKQEQHRQELEPPPEQQQYTKEAPGTLGVLLAALRKVPPAAAVAAPAAVASQALQDWAADIVKLADALIHNFRWAGGMREEFGLHGSVHLEKAWTVVSLTAGWRAGGRAGPRPRYAA